MFEALKDSFKNLESQISTVSREVETIKTKPASSPANTLAISRSTLSDKERFLKGLMSPSEAEQYKLNAFKQVFGMA